MLAKIKWMPVHDLVIDALWFQEDQCYRTGLAKLTLTGLPLVKIPVLKWLQYLERAKARGWLMRALTWIQRSLRRGSKEQCWDNLNPLENRCLSHPLLSGKWRVGKARPLSQLPHWLLWCACHQILHCVSRTNAGIAIELGCEDIDCFKCGMSTRLPKCISAVVGSPLDTIYKACSFCDTLHCWPLL